MIIKQVFELEFSAELKASEEEIFEKLRNFKPKIPEVKEVKRLDLLSSTLLNIKHKVARTPQLTRLQRNYNLSNSMI